MNEWRTDPSIRNSNVGICMRVSSMEAVQALNPNSAVWINVFGFVLLHILSSFGNCLLSDGSHYTQQAENI
jgi:hypothetical protein